MNNSNRKHIFKLLAPAFVSTMLVADIAAASEYLSQDELKHLLVGKTFEYSGDTTGKTVVREDGTFAVVGDSKYGNLSGRWWFNGSNWCRVYDPFGYEICSQYQAVSDGKIKSTSGYILEFAPDIASGELKSPQS